MRACQLLPPMLTPTQVSLGLSPCGGYRRIPFALAGYISAYCQSSVAHRMDLWFERRLKKSRRGNAFLVRYFDDFIAYLEHEDEVHRFRRDMAERLAAFDLEVEPSKTAELLFGTLATSDCHRDGLRRPPTFSFLGLTHYVSRSRRGRFVVGHKTERKHFQRLHPGYGWSGEEPGWGMYGGMLKGTCVTHGVSGSYRALRRCVVATSRRILK